MLNVRVGLGLQNRACRDGHRGDVLRLGNELVDNGQDFSTV